MACEWKNSSDEMKSYHDTEWGVPTHDDKKLFEYLVLESMQAGLSWQIVLHKRETMRKCFANFDVKKVANLNQDDIDQIMKVEDMIKSIRKIQAMITNAQAFMHVQEEFGSFDQYLWSFSKNQTICYQGRKKGEMVASNQLSTIVSKDLKKRGFKFVGPVIVYSYLQACGIINDHEDDCECYRYIRQNYPCIDIAEDGIL
ncbi:MAG: DNA-3-methyladenine glycosylase I [Erysipelotrichaceae bacterium]|nr:DNA-3-methyladenine glycosylase I [Erysipelotrichaceae bacterium]MDY6035575.1 DNA-3-methyladenine glycosylase I [Bulleidia sp.]